MKISIEKININSNQVYKILNVEKCCDKIINSKSICINSKYNTEYSVKLIEMEDCYDKYDDFYYINYNYEKINFCPFCAKPIFITITKETDKTKDYNNLEKEKNTLLTTLNNTDSIKEKKLLQEKLTLINKIINELSTEDNSLICH